MSKKITSLFKFDLCKRLRLQARIRLRRLLDLAGTNIDQGLHLQGVSLGDYISVIGAGLGSVGFMPAEIKADKKKGGGRSAKDSLSSIGNNDKLPYIVLGVGTAAAIVITAMALVPYFLVKNENDSLQERKAQLAPVLHSRSRCS